MSVADGQVQRRAADVRAGLLAATAATDTWRDAGSDDQRKRPRPCDQPGVASTGTPP